VQTELESVEWETASEFVHPKIRNGFSQEETEATEVQSIEINVGTRSVHFLGESGNLNNPFVLCSLRFLL
jgi:hypothetical protein